MAQPDPGASLEAPRSGRGWRSIAPRASSDSPTASYIAILIFAAVLLILPFILGTRYLLQLSITTLIWVGMAVAWNMFSGATRYFSLGSAGFFGVGAYVALLTTPIVGMAVGLLLAALGAALVGLLVGVSTLRLRGLYFTLVTIGLGEALRLVALFAQPITRGGTGVTLREQPPLELVYAITAGLLLVLVTVSVVLRASRIGLRLVAIRDDEDSLAAAGVRVDRYKILGFAATVAPMGIFGGLYGFQLGFIHPQSVFILALSLTVVIMVLLGGIGTVWGPVVGGIVLGLIMETLWFRFPFIHELILGLLLIAIVLFMPSGVIGWLRRLIPIHRGHIT